MQHQHQHGPSSQHQHVHPMTLSQRNHHHSAESHHHRHQHHVLHHHHGQRPTSIGPAGHGTSALPPSLSGVGWAVSYSDDCRNTDMGHLLMSMSFFCQVAKAGIAGAHATIMLVPIELYNLLSSSPSEPAFQRCLLLLTLQIGIPMYALQKLALTHQR
jgi:hypothetical protein